MLLAAPAPKELPLSQAQTEALGMAVNSCVAGRATELLPEIALPVNAKAFQPLTGNYQARLEDLGEMLGAW